MECPWCSGDRRNKKDLCLSLRPTDEGVLYNCWHCSAKGIALYKAEHSGARGAFLTTKSTRLVPKIVGSGFFPPITRRHPPPSPANFKMGKEMAIVEDDIASRTRHAPFKSDRDKVHAAHSAPEGLSLKWNQNPRPRQNEAMVVKSPSVAYWVGASAVDIVKVADHNLIHLTLPWDKSEASGHDRWYEAPSGVLNYHYLPTETKPVMFGPENDVAHLGDPQEEWSESGKNYIPELYSFNIKNPSLSDFSIIRLIEEKIRSMSLKNSYRPLTDKAIEWLKGRGISKDSAIHLGILSTDAWSRKMSSNAEGIAFPYKDGFKIRFLDVKDFSADGKIGGMWRAIHPDYNGLPVICEGEMDAISFFEAGITAYSIPNGAINPGSDGGAKLDCLQDISDEIIDGAILALDNDEPGTATSEEIARRIGKAICNVAQWPLGIKDANQLLTTEGAVPLRKIAEEAKPYPIEGLYDVGHFSSQVKELYIKGLGKGLSTGYQNLDELYSIAGGQLTIVTGAPSSGKSELVDQIMVNVADQHEWRFAVCSFENPPKLHIAKLASKREGKPFFTGPTKRMDEFEMSRAIDWVRDHFFFVHDDHGSTSDLNSILDRLRAAILRYGIRGAVIDPYNYISRPSSRDVSETQWISEMLTEVAAFARAYDVHVWFVAHPAKMQRGADGKIPVPKGYDISGSAAWFAKADFGLTVHRPDPLYSNDSEVHVWKCRFSWMGKQGITNLVYHPASYSYSEPQGRTSYADIDF